MSSEADEKLIPRTDSINYSYVEPGHVLAHLSVTLEWKKDTNDVHLRSSKFPIGWKHKWFFTVSTYPTYTEGAEEVTLSLRAHRSRGNSKDAYFCVTTNQRSLSLNSEGYIAKFNERPFPYSVDSYAKNFFSKIFLMIRIKLDEDLAYLEKRKSERSVHFRNAFKEQFSKGLSTDVTLIANDGKFTSAHWKFLTARSPVFLAMHSQEFQERKTNEIKLELDFESLKAFLEFIYTGQMDFESVEMVQNLFKAGHMYQIDELKDAAEDFLIKSVDADNALDLLVLANKYCVPRLWELASITLKRRGLVPPKD